MKKVFYVSMFALALGSCTNEFSEDATLFQKEVVNVSLPDVDSRTIMDGNSVKWESADHIGIFKTSGNSYVNNDFVLKTGANTTSATFEAEKTTGDVNALAYYPYNAGASYNGTSLTLPLESEYTYGATTHAVMAAELSDGNATNIAFKNAGTLVAITVKNVPQGYTHAVMTAAEKIAGKATVTFSNGTPTLAIADDASSTSISIDFTDNTDASKTFYFPVPVGEYSEGLKIALTGDQQEEKVIGTLKNSNTDATFSAKRNEIHRHTVTYNDQASGGIEEVVTDAATLKEKLAEGATITLGDEVTELSASDLNVPAGVSSVLDLNGKTLKLDATSTTALARSTSATHGIINSGTLTISDGKIVYTSEDVNKSAIYNKTSGNITLTNVTVESNNNNYGLLNYGVMTIEDGTITFEGNTEANGAAVFNAAQIQLNDVDITSNNGCFMNYGDATKTTLEGLKAEDATVTAVINGGTFNSSFNKSESHTQHRYAVNGAWYSNLTMDGTTITGSGGVTVNVSFATLTNVKAEHTCQYGAHDLYVPCGNATVTNCTFANAAAYSDDTYGKAVVNGVTYANGTTGITHDLTTRDALIKGFAEGGTVTLTGHSKLYNSSLTLPADKTLTLDLNGKTLTWNAPAAYGFHNKGNLTIKNGTIIFTGNHSAGAAIINRGDITMEGVSITANAKCFYNSGSWTEDYTELEDHGDSPAIVATITGGTFNSTPQHVTTGYHIYAIETEYYSKLVMKDAIVEGDGGVSVDASYAALTNVTATHTCTQGAHDIYVPCGNATITSCTYTNAAAYSDTKYGIAVVNDTLYNIPDGKTNVTAPIVLN